MTVPTTPDAAVDTDDRLSRPHGFVVRLDNFQGPFDLLLQLIGKHQLDVTELALHTVTDDFIAHLAAAGDGWNLDQATEFLVVASTLLDLKAARLLPAADVEDTEDLALLEARDLLFARLLQYRAYKQAAAFVAERFNTIGRCYPREVSLEPRFAELMPEVLLAISVEQFALIATQAMAAKPVPTVAIGHLHSATVSVGEQTVLLRQRLRGTHAATFRALCSDCASTLEVVARFLALLELYRNGEVGFDQLRPLGELHVRWVGGTEEQNE
ncbi:MAG: segregation and condensation protein A [Mycobacteriales bacterium]